MCLYRNSNTCYQQHRALKKAGQGVAIFDRRLQISNCKLRLWVIKILTFLQFLPKWWFLASNFAFWTNLYRQQGKFQFFDSPKFTGGGILPPSHDVTAFYTNWLATVLCMQRALLVALCRRWVPQSSGCNNDASPAQGCSAVIQQPPLTLSRQGQGLNCFAISEEIVPKLAV